MIIDGHIFFQLGDLLNHKLADYDIANGKIRQIEFSDVSKWELQDYDLIHALSGQSNVLHFHYTTAGNRIEDGKDYPRGFYSFDIQTGNIKQVDVSRFAKGIYFIQFRSNDQVFTEKVIVQ